MRTFRNQKDTLGIDLTIQTLTGEAHSKFSAHEGVVGEMLDEIRIAVKKALTKLEQVDDEVPGI